MKAKEEFSSLYSRYLKRLYLKIALISLVISLAVLLVLSLSFWIVGFKYYWIEFIVFGVVLIASFTILYFVKKPTEKEFFSSIEELGLSQRAITMYEFKDDNSVIAKMQRENAKVNIENKDHKALKITAPLALIITVSVVFAFSILGSIASALSANRIIPSAVQAINGTTTENEIKEYEVSFEVIGDGFIDGDIFQLVKEGQDAEGVYAEAEEGWFFYSWGVYDKHYDKVVTDDKNEVPEDHDPYRVVKDVRENITYYAVFVEIPESSEDESEDGEDDGNQSPSQPSDEQTGQPSQGTGSGGGEGGGKYEDSNQIIDGSTYYGDTVFDNAYTTAMEQMQEGDYGEDLEKIVNDYFENIEK